jgi:LysR family transcriptional regulator of abg operon
MTLDQLRAFVAVVEHGSIRSAARSLDLAQSGLTQQIKRLELALNVKLFARGHSGIALTASGDTLLARARIILTECERAQLEVGSADEHMTGAVAVGVSSEAFARILLPVIAQFRQRFRRVSVHLASGPAGVLMSRIREGRLDFAITLVSSHTDMTDLAATTMDIAHPAIVCRRGHPLQHATQLQQLRQAEWINTGPAGKRGLPSSRLYDMFADAGCGRPDVVLTVESLFDTLKLLVNSDLLFLAPDFVLQESGFGDALAQIAVQDAIPQVNLSLLQRAGTPLPLAARELAAMAISYASLQRRQAT